MALADSPSSASDDARLDEVIVTATKENEPARAIAGSITVLSGQDLDAIGAQSFADYLTRVPGVVFNNTEPGLSSVTIRGVSTTTFLDLSQGTTAYFLNDVPLTDPGSTLAIADIDAFDVNNVSVLRGPQGTLFGSASLGGAINYEAAPPDLTKFEGRVQGTVAGASVGAGSRSEKVMLNLPLVENRLAVRAVFVDRDDGGYYDNIGTGAKNSNEVLVRGGRIEVLWAPTDGTKVNYLFLKQTEDNKDYGYQEPAVAGPLEKKTLIPEPFDFDTTINNLRLDQDVGFATVTATAAYHEKSQHHIGDLTVPFGPLFGGQLTPVSVQQDASDHGTTFELRLASKPGGRFDYVVGLFHDLTFESFHDVFSVPGAEQYVTRVFDPVFGAGFGQRATSGNTFFLQDVPSKYEEKAIFGEVSFHFNDEWKITLGGREFETKDAVAISSFGLLQFFNSQTLNFNYDTPQSATGFTPKASITWTPTGNIMAYVLASKGFRFGGPNVNPPNPKAPFPQTFGPDTLWNYEIGTHTDWLDRRLQIDADVFYVDWRNIQVSLNSGALSYDTNFGKATTYGFEGTTRWKPTGGLTVEGNVTYLDAALRQAVQFGATNELAGTPLPGASKWNLGATVRYDWLNLPLQPAAQLSDQFISTALAGYDFVEPITQGNYNLLNGRVSGRFKGLEATVFCNNIADKRGVLAASYGFGAPFTQYIVRPRTYGLTLDYRF